MSALVDVKKIEDGFKKDGYVFSVNNFYVLCNNIWICGNLDFYPTNQKGGEYLIKECYPAVIYSENKGVDYRLLKVFKELNPFNFYGEARTSNILFLEKNNGYLAVHMGGHYMVFKTSDGGLNWNEILNTKNMPVIFKNKPIGYISYIKRIRIDGQNIFLIISFQKDGRPELIESNNLGASWIYKHDNKEVAKTSNGGLTWEIVKNEK